MLSLTARLGWGLAFGATGIWRPALKCMRAGSGWPVAASTTSIFNSPSGWEAATAKLSTAAKPKNATVDKQIRLFIADRFR